MQQRREFVLRALEPGANISALCLEYRISRKTGYKWLHRFRESGLLGLRDQPRRKSSTAFRCSVPVSLDIVFLKQRYPSYGPKKIRRMLMDSWPASELPSLSTISRVVRYAGLAKKKRRVQRYKAGPGRKPDVAVEAPNDLWTVDFKGWWNSRNGKRCEPLTVRDEYSRFVLAIDIVDAPSIACVRPVFERIFALHGLPKAIQTDNGVPFSASQSYSGMTQLSAWWVALGLRFVRSRVAKPQDNGGHERMHRDMKDQLQKHPSWSPEQQQEACDHFRRVFNWERPHQALGQEVPASVYLNSPRPFTPGDPLLKYPADWHVRKVTKCGTMRYRRFQRSVGKAFAGQYVGVEQLDEKRFRVWFAEVCIGVGDLPWINGLRPPGREDEQPETLDESQEM